MLSEELSTSISFKNIQGEHWGEGQTRRIFLDNLPSGTCKSCDQYPESRKQPFLCMKLTIPKSTASICHSSLIQSHYSESPDIVKMKCSNCCPHDKEGIECTQTGMCSRPAVTHMHLTKAPQFLFVQLLRFGNGYNGPKVMTCED